MNDEYGMLSRDRWEEKRSTISQIIEILLSSENRVDKRYKLIKILSDIPLDENVKRISSKNIDMRGIKIQNRTVRKLDKNPYHLNFSYSDFNNSKFYGAILHHSYFENADFRNCTFVNCYFHQCKFCDMYAQETRFIDCRFYNCDFSGCTITDSEITGSSFIYCSFEKYDNSVSSLRNVKYAPKLKDLYVGKIYYKYFKDKFYKEFNTYEYLYSKKKYHWDYWFYTDFHGTDLSSANTLQSSDLLRYVKDQEYLRIFKKKNKHKYNFWNVFTKCGWSEIRVIFFSLLIILTFAFLYAAPYPTPDLIFNILPDCVKTDAQTLFIGHSSLISNSVEIHPFFRDFYISFDIFTNLGIRQTYPSSNWGVILMFVETILGFVTLGLLIAIATNKYARRS